MATKGNNVRTAKTKRTLILAFAALLSACGTTIELRAPERTGAARLTVLDSRQASEKVYARSSVLSSVQMFGDEDFSPPPLTQFGRLVESGLASGGHEMQVEQFRVMDIFPRRLAAGTSGAVTGALGSMGYAVFFPASSADPTVDNITCLASGALDGRRFQLKESVPYKISPLAGMVKSDPAFKDAVNSCLDQISRKVAATQSSAK